MILKEQEKSKRSIPETISYLLDRIFGISMSENEVREAFMEIKLSDILNLDTAFDNRDEDLVRQILGNYLSEYSLPGRSNVRSSAPPPKKNTPTTNTPQKTTTAPTTTNNDDLSGTLNPDQLRIKQDLEAKEKEKEELEKDLQDIKKAAGIK